MTAEVARQLREIVPECRRSGVSRLWVFGSATGKASRRFSDNSDLDLLVEFDPSASIPSGFEHPLFTLPLRLSEVLGRDVHLTENLEFKNPYFRDEVIRTRELIYDRVSEQALVGHRAGG